MKRSSHLDIEHERANDLWAHLHAAEQLAINHDYYGPTVSDMLNKCLSIVEEYQNELLTKLFPDDEQ